MTSLHINISHQSNTKNQTSEGHETLHLKKYQVNHSSHAHPQPKTTNNMSSEEVRLNSKHDKNKIEVFKETKVNDGNVIRYLVQNRKMTGTMIMTQPYFLIQIIKEV